MNIFNQISSILLPAENRLIQNEDKFSSYEISYSVTNFLDYNFEELENFTSLIPDEEEWILSIKIGNSDSIRLNKGNNDNFQEAINSEKYIFDNEEVQLNFKIKKQRNNYIYIYDFESFSELWEKSSLVNVLNLIKKYRNSSNRLDFVLVEDEIKQFNSKGISFLHSANETITTFGKECISDNCHFGNVEDYPFDAYFFNLIERPNSPNKISVVLDKLTLAFSVISIFDITSISENDILYKLNGYKTFEGKLSFSELNIDLSSLYFKIFNWIYCEESNVSDKIGLVRNIISLSLKENTIHISDSVYLSILSGYKTYLQENISKYIELRNKIVDELSWISNKSGEIVTGHLNNYQKSIFTFLSFFISVFILRFLKGGDTENVFTKEVTLFSLAFLLLSLLFLIFSHWNMKLEKERLNRKYQNIKNRYTDLLDENDIERILKDDSEFNYELSYIEKRRKNYTRLWVVTVIVLISTILCVSDYLDWNMIFELIRQCQWLIMANKV